MADGFSAKIEGAEELYTLLKALPEKAAKRIETGAIRKAANKLRDRARDNIRPTKRPPGDTSEQPYSDEGVLKYSFDIRIKNKNGRIYGDVANRAPHAHLVEFGHRISKTKLSRNKGNGAGLRQVPPHPFMRTALNQIADELGNFITADMKAAVEKWNKKNG